MSFWTCTQCDKDNKIDYVWLIQALEYEATKIHLEKNSNKKLWGNDWATVKQRNQSVCM